MSVSDCSVTCEDDVIIPKQYLYIGVLATSKIFVAMQAKNLWTTL